MSALLSGVADRVRQIVPSVIVLACFIMLGATLPAVASTDCPGLNSCSGCPACGTCLICTGIGANASCGCACIPCPGGGSRVIGTIDRYGGAGVALSTSTSFENNGATLATQINAFILYYNWGVIFGGGVDPNDFELGDVDFTNVSGTSLLDSLSSTFDLCYEVDSGSYTITINPAGECS